MLELPFDERDELGGGERKRGRRVATARRERGGDGGVAGVVQVAERRGDEGGVAVEGGEEGRGRYGDGGEGVRWHGVCGIGWIKNLNYFSYGLRLRKTFVSVSAVRKQNSVLICFEQRLEVRAGVGAFAGM